MPEEVRLKNVEAYRENLRQTCIKLETKSLFAQEKLKARPPADRVPIDSVWGRSIGTNVDMRLLPREFILNWESFEEDGYFSVRECVLIEIENSTRRDLQRIAERLEELKLEQEIV